MISIYELRNISPEDFKRILYRAQANIDEVRQDVIKIIQRVRRDGDRALVELTKELDDSSYTQDKLVVSDDDFNRVRRYVPGGKNPFSTVRLVLGIPSLLGSFSIAKRIALPNALNKASTL